MKAFDDFKVKVTIPVSWGDMDALGHVNNVNYLRYFDHARSQYFIESGCYSEFKQIGIQAVIKSINCQFISPIHFPETILVGARIEQIKDDGFIMEHFISTEEKGLIAYCEIELALINITSGKAIDMSNAVIKLINDFEKK